MTDVNKIKYTSIPRAVILISSGGTGIDEEFTAVPVKTYTLTKSNSDTPDKLVFKCNRTQFPDDLITEMFLADGRSGRYIVKLYSNYTNIEETFVKNNDNKYIYNQELIDEIVNDDNLRFYGTIDNPSYDESIKKEELTFEAHDLSYFLRTTTTIGSYSDYTCVELIEHIAKEKGLISFIKIAPRVNKNTKIGSKGQKEGYKYVTKDKSFWEIIKDCGKHLGELIIVNNDVIEIGRFQNDVNDFTYNYGYIPDSSSDEYKRYSPLIEGVRFYKQRKLTDKIIRVEIRNYIASTMKWEIGLAETDKDTPVKELKADSKSASSSSKKGKKFRPVKRFVFYQNDYEGNLDDLAYKILSNIIFKKWKFSFKTQGNPYIQIHDQVTINGFFRNSGFEKILWVVSQITETYFVKGGYKTKIILEGILIQDIPELSREQLYRDFGVRTRVGKEVSDNDETKTSPDSPYGKDVPNGGKNSDPLDPDLVKFDYNKWFNAPTSSPYGWRNHPLYKDKRFHTGVDLANGDMVKGNPVKVPFGGEVVLARPYGGFGKTVIVRHDDNYFTLYGHLNSISVTTKDIVKRGDTIGTCGRTGGVTGVHLHYEARNASSHHIHPGSYNGPKPKSTP